MLETSVRSFDYLRGLKQIEQEVMDAIRRVLYSGQLILGHEGETFENQFAEFAGAAHAIAVGSGTDALILALMAVGVGPGDEVITVANSAVPTASAIRATGAIPRFVDVDPATLLMNIELVESMISPATRCLLPVHLYGLSVAMEPLRSVARKHNLRIVEDCAHAHGATSNGTHVGNFGDVGCFSFYPTKNLGAYGDGGICITNDETLATNLRSLRMYGFRDDRIAHQDGRNSRLDELQAAVLAVKLKSLNSAVSRRREIAARYIRELADLAAQTAGRWLLPSENTIPEHAFHQFVIRVPDRAMLIDHLVRNQIGFGIHYQTPLHQMPAFRRDGDAPLLPVTESAASQILSLPMYPELTEDEISHVIHILKEFLQLSGSV